MFQAQSYLYYIAIASYRLILKNMQYLVKHIRIIVTKIYWQTLTKIVKILFWWKNYIQTSSKENYFLLLPELSTNKLLTVVHTTRITGLTF